MRLTRTAGLLAIALALGGCFQSTTVLRVKADRSGTIEQQSVLSVAALGQLKQFAQLGGSQQASADPMSEEQARALAANIGPGVTYVSSKPVTTDTMQGRDALYAFTDINQLRITQQPAAPGGVSLRADSLGPPQTITFSLEPGAGGNQVLHIHMPQLQQLPGLPVQLPGGAPTSSTQSLTDDQIAMARQMFAGMRMTVAVEPDGRVIQTNSPYIDGNRVTLFDLDFDRLVADPDALRALQDVHTPEQAQAVIGKIPGLKVTLEREITIEFAPAR